MKALKYLLGIVLGVAGVGLFVMTVSYAATVDGSMCLPYVALGLLAGSYALVRKSLKEAK